MRRIEAIVGTPFRNGVITNMPKCEYFAACGLNPSSLKKPSPKHIKWAYENNGKTTDDMLKGQAVHILCLEPHRFEEDVVVWTGKTRRGKKWDEFKAENDGKVIIAEKAFKDVCNIGKSVTSDPLVKELIREGVAEVAVFTDEEGMQCRTQLDWVSNSVNGVLCDIKDSNSILARRFGRTFFNFGYDISLACGRRWFQREAKKEITAVKLITVEFDPPHDVAVVPIDENVLDNGWKKALAKIKQVRECIENDRWPGIAGGEEYPLEVPYSEMEEELVEYEE